MQKVDRLVWAAGVCFTAYGWKIGVRLNRPEGLQRVAACLPPGWEPAEPPFVDFLFSLRLGGAERARNTRHYNLLYYDAALAARSLDAEEVYDALESHLALFLAERARERVFVHAGVVAFGGKALMIPARSGCGKSSLVKALLRAGADYFSDEYAVLDPQGRVHPYPRRLSLRRPGGRPLRCGPEEFGARTGAGPLPLALIALTKFQPGARWHPRPVAPGPAALEVLNHTVCACSQPVQAMSTLFRAVPAATVLKGVRGEADAAADVLLRHLSN